MQRKRGKIKYGTWKRRKSHGLSGMQSGLGVGERDGVGQVI